MVVVDDILLCVLLIYSFWILVNNFIFACHHLMVVLQIDRTKRFIGNVLKQIAVPLCYFLQSLRQLWMYNLSWILWYMVFTVSRFLPYFLLLLSNLFPAVNYFLSESWMQYLLTHRIPYFVFQYTFNFRLQEAVTRPVAQVWSILAFFKSFNKLS